jgi:hypothetical protein
VTGLQVERTADRIVLRDATGVLTSINASDIEEVLPQAQSLMPAGQILQLSGRQQFLDLVRYLYEIRDHGPDRARQLQPSPALLTVKLPEYESHLDHAGLIRGWNADSLKRGEAIYRRVCANCHGTRDQAGSLPTSLKFAEGRFKNGSDPLSMYRTLTRGFGFMPAQSWMVPSQKYDVIHYIREAYLKPYNPGQWTTVDARYFDALPAGDTTGPEPSGIEPWSAMDYGSWLTHCYEVPGDSLNIAYKGIAIRLDEGAGGVARGEQWMLFDTDTLRMSAGWVRTPDESNERFVDWRGVQFNGEHNVHPTVVGDVIFANATGPGWALPGTPSFDDAQRVQGRDGRRYGPLPRTWAKYRGLYAHGTRAVLSYSVGATDVLESPEKLDRIGSESAAVFVRTFNLGPRETSLELRVSDLEEGGIEQTRPDSGDVDTVITPLVTAGVSGNVSNFAWSDTDGRLTLRIPAGKQELEFALWLAEGRLSLSSTQQIAAQLRDRCFGLQELTRGGPARWQPPVETPMTAARSEPGAAFIADILTPPDSNPWLAHMRLTGLDFFRDGSLAVSTWDGDVWRVAVDDARQQLSWRRMATGLYQPLGVRVIDDVVHAGCRDQIVVLRDLNNNGETDFYECLNNDHQVTEHFHEFAMGLQTDAAGNFYYAKSARHALPALVPHHGTLLRVTPDGQRTDILANGFRAANGVCLNPDGSFFVTDQEGHWNPKNRINWVTTKPDCTPNFYGNMFGYHDVTDASDSAMQPPLCWITNSFDRSPGELLWVDSPAWGSLNGGLLNLSYGTGKVFVVLQEEAGGVRQGGMIELPGAQFPTGVMRGRFHPADGHLYLCGMFAWAGSATQPGGLYRIRATGKPVPLPTSLRATTGGLQLAFAEPLDAESVTQQSVNVRTWALKRTSDYGSDHFDERGLQVRGVSLSEDRRTVTIVCDDLAPTWCMEIQFQFRSTSGGPVRGVIHNTVHELTASR